ncbi:hypothetical protein [Candidatus Protochlamydia phocaeensis]|uniref:hypothetical protein n=1 Tax=Candidatus Protochlamydia phocaeensis TaxID=1414722 RepID=UPI0008397867|nr:hypothetical protein [Candidatus Protochlamydia phocaeensis]
MDSPSEATKKKQPSQPDSPKKLKKAIQSLENCLANELLTDQERSNLEEAVIALKQSLKNPCKG